MAKAANESAAATKSARLELIIANLKLGAGKAPKECASASILPVFSDWNSRRLFQFRLGDINDDSQVLINAQTGQVKLAQKPLLR